MKKIIFAFIGFLLVVVGIVVFVPTIKKINELPADMVVTCEDVENANGNNEFGRLVNISLTEKLGVATDKHSTNAWLTIKLFNLFTIKTINVKLLTDTEVFVGGETVGFNLYSEGVICVGNNSVVTKEGLIEPLLDSGIQEGDAIKKIGGIEISSIQDIDNALNMPENAGKSVVLTIQRGNEQLDISVNPVFDLLSQKYKLGLWVRNNASGVGTLTYVKQSDFRFGAVGHPIVEENMEENFMVSDGEIYKCRLLGIKKGRKNEPGEIRSSINLSDDAIGKADTNCKYGVYGTIYNKNIIDATRSANLGGRLNVKLGNAKIYCAIDNDGVKAYDVKIIKLNKQSKADEQGMIIKITDEELLEKTGGIIQGMSGSPIVQDGKIIGAITHVMVDDPTRGFGVYIDWMINN